MLHPVLIPALLTTSWFTDTQPANVSAAGKRSKGVSLSTEQEIDQRFVLSICLKILEQCSKLKYQAEQTTWDQHGRSSPSGNLL